MRRHSNLFALLGCVAFTNLAFGQVPPAPATPAAGVAAAQQAAPLAGAADVGFFGKCFQACEDCKRKLCAMPLGTMLNSMTAPFSAMSGGVIPNFCPTTPTKEDLAKPGVEGASAQAKKDAAEAKARRASVRYLGTLDCRYYPEAEGALIAALRTDGVECVRWEAALVLGKGCCCSKKVIEALTHAVSCSEKDGNPAERSDRVRFAACLALERCLACFSEPAEVKEEDTKVKEKPATPKESGKGESDKPTSRTPDRNTILAARAAIKKLHDRYGIDTSKQIRVVQDEMVKLTPVPNAAPVVNAPSAASPVKTTPVLVPMATSTPVMTPAQPQQLKVINTPNGVMVINPPAPTVPVTTVTTVPVSAAPPVKKEPKSLFSLLRGSSSETTVPPQSFQHPMEQYQQPLNGIQPVGSGPGGR